MPNWEDFDSKIKARHAEFDRDFAKSKREAKIIAAIMLPLYLIGVLLILGLLAVALYGLARYVGLI